MHDDSKTDCKKACEALEDAFKANEVIVQPSENASNHDEMSTNRHFLNYDIKYVSAV